MLSSLNAALAFHEITTQVPHAISIAPLKGADTPRLDDPSIVTHRFSGPALTKGIAEHSIDGVPVKIYSPEKTLADCFKFRNKIDMDVVLEALKLYKARRKLDIGIKAMLLFSTSLRRATGKSICIVLPGFILGCCCKIK